VERIALRIDPNQPYQAQTITISPNGNSISLRLELRYLVYTDKWYLSIWDASKNVCLLTYVPIVSCEEVLNDLLSLFQYMNIGSVICVPVSAQMYGTDPGESNFDQFEVQWGDGLG
jgi:hypothetical protein